MHRVSPAPLADAARADGTVADRDERAIAQPDVPAVAFGTGAADSQVAAQIADRVLTELVDQKVGQRALRDSAEVERRTRCECRRARAVIQEEHLGECRQLHRVKDRRLRQALPEGPIVSGGRQGWEDRGVDESFAFLERPEGRLQHGEHFRAHGEVAAVARIESGQLAVTKKTGKARLRIANPLLATFERRRSALDAQQLAGGAECVEVAGRQFRRHGFHCGPWRRSAARSPPAGVAPAQVWAPCPRHHLRAGPATACPAPTPTSASRSRTCFLSLTYNATVHRFWRAPTLR